MANILVIDDDAAVRGLFERILQADGHAVYLAANTAAAIDVLHRSAIEMVITDLKPEDNGLEVVSVLRRDFPTTKVVIVSSEFGALPTDPLLDTVEVLPKPVGVSHLRETVHRVLSCH
jgi:DNA-binding NtrC family response regulator